MKHLKQKYAGLSFAEAATKIGSKYPKRDLDLTAKKSYEMEMAELMRMNESAKMISDAQDKVKELLACGGKVKMAKGYAITDPFAIGVPPGNTAWMSQQNGMPMMAPPLLGQPLSALSTPSRFAGNTPPVQFPQLYKPDESAFTTPPLSGSSTPKTSAGFTPAKPTLNMLTLPTKPGLENPLPMEGELTATDNSLNPSGQITLGSAMASNVNKEGQVDVVGGQPYNPTKKGNWFQKTFGEEGNVYTPALLGSAANIGINAAILAGGYDKVAPNTNKYEDEARTTMQDRGIDMTAVQNRIQGAFNAGRENLKNARSANVRNAFDQNLSVGAMEQTANASLQQQQINNQYKADYANVINNLGMQDVQARNLSDELTARNKGQFQSNLSQFGANVAENSKFFTKLKANDKMNALYLDIINQSSNDFQIDPELLGKLKQGKFSDISEGQWLQLKKSDNTAVKAFAEFYAKQKTNG